MGVFGLCCVCADHGAYDGDSEHGYLAYGGGACEVGAGDGAWGWEYVGLFGPRGWACAGRVCVCAWGGRGGDRLGLVGLFSWGFAVCFGVVLSHLKQEGMTCLMLLYYYNCMWNNTSSGLHKIGKGAI